MLLIRSLDNFPFDISWLFGRLGWSFFERFRSFVRFENSENDPSDVRFLVRPTDRLNRWQLVCLLFDEMVSAVVEWLLLAGEQYLKTDVNVSGIL